MLSSRSTILAIVGLLSANLFWAINALLARGFHQEIAAFDLNFLRWLGAFLILTPFALKKVKKDWHTIKKNKYNLTFLGFLGVTSFNFILYQSAHHTQAINIGLINTLAPIATLLFSILILRIKFSFLSFVGILIGILGAIIIVFKGDPTQFSHFQVFSGDVLMIGGTFVWGLYTVLIKKWHIDIHPISFLWSVMLFGLLILLLIFPFAEFSATNVLHSRVGLVILYVTIFPSILAYLFWNFGVAKIGAPLSAIFIYTNPCFIALIGVITNQETLQLYHFIGGALILTALITLFFSQNHARNSATQRARLPD